MSYAPIVEFICEAIVASDEETRITKHTILKLLDHWTKQGTFREGSSSHHLLKMILSNPIFSVKQVQHFLKVSKPAANHAVHQLLQAKIIRERTNNERYRVFAAEEVLEVLARNFSEPPTLAHSRATELLLA